jgi:hypothetical protein
MKLIDRLRAVRIGLIEDAGKFYKLASFWAFVLIGAMPDIYNGIASLGWIDQVPPRFSWILRGLAAGGIAVRVLRRRTACHHDGTDEAGA